MSRSGIPSLMSASVAFVAVLAVGVICGSLAFVLTRETAARPMPAAKKVSDGWQVTWSERFGTLVLGGESVAWQNERCSRLFVMGWRKGEIRELEAGVTETAQIDVSGRYAVWETARGRIVAMDMASRRILRVTGSDEGSSPALDGSAVAWTSGGSRLMWRWLPSGREQVVADRDDSLWLQPVAALKDGGAVWLEIAGERPRDRGLVAKGWGDESGLQVLVHRGGTKRLLDGCVANDQVAAWIEYIRGNDGRTRSWELWCRRADRTRPVKLVGGRYPSVRPNPLCVRGRRVFLALRGKSGDVVRAYGSGAPRTVLSLGLKADLLACNGTVAAWTEDGHTVMMRRVDD